MTERDVSSSSLDATTEKEHKCLTSEVGRKTITENDTGDVLLCGTCSKMFSSLDNFNRHTFLVSECQAFIFPEIDLLQGTILVQSIIRTNHYYRNTA